MGGVLTDWALRSSDEAWLSCEIKYKRLHGRYSLYGGEGALRLIEDSERTSDEGRVEEERAPHLLTPHATSARDDSRTT
eukprot:2802711-Rhodomonas_salina.8